MRSPRRLLVTGGAGFIGSALTRWMLDHRSADILTLDKLTYAGQPSHVQGLGPRHTFVEGDVADRALLDRLFAEHRPDAVVHLAAETHVDRSIDGPLAFVHTNVLGTATLLEAARAAWGDRRDVLLLHVSTDEVFGSIPAGERVDLGAPYAPSSPYSASKAGADHLVRAWHRTWGLPTVVTHCTNNYGPRQFPEKLIPLALRRALRGEAIPLYGDGAQRRDWLHVDDHCAALDCVLRRAAPGSTTLVASEQELPNRALLRLLCRLLDEERPRPGGYEGLIRSVPDRPGHDSRYALSGDSARALGWAGPRPLEEGLRQTVRWVLAHEPWTEAALGRAGYGTERLGR